MGDARKICVVTAARAEYGQLRRLMRLIGADKALRLQTIVTGMHLSPECGMTVRYIEADGFKIDRRIEMLLSSDSPVAACKSMGLAQISFAEAFSSLAPDIVVILGDRYELLPVAAAALVLGIPLAHIGGGASTEGAVDDAVRHSLTKMSHLHFTSAENERLRVMQMGEDPARVFNFGELSLDLLDEFPPMSRREFEKSADLRLKKRNLLVTFHPPTAERGAAKKQFAELLRALGRLEDTLLIFTRPNADPESSDIVRMTDEHVVANPGRAVCFATMGQAGYFAAMRLVDAVVGNSSSGLAEAPSFKTATVNVGDRQQGRLKAASVIDCRPDAASIGRALEKAFSPEFKKILRSVRNPYGEGGASEKIKNVLKRADLRGILKKSFHDLIPLRFQI